MGHTLTPPIDEEHVDSLKRADRQTLCTFIRRACSFRRMDAETDGKNPPGWTIYAWPYAEALASMPSDQKMYYADSTHGLLLYLRTNLSTWRDEPWAKVAKTRLDELIQEEKP